MKLHKVKAADLDFIRNFCESRLLTEIGNMHAGVGNPIEEIEKICRILDSIAKKVPCDHVAIEPVPTPSEINDDARAVMRKRKSA